jgi:hypothetical protein
LSAEAIGLVQSPRPSDQDLSEGHAEKLIETREVASPLIAMIASDATIELAPWQEVDQL